MTQGFNKDKILILCKVVDNFGDVGVVYRLAKSLTELNPALTLTLVISELNTFSSMAGEISAEKAAQTFKYKSTTWNIIDWNAEKADIPDDFMRTAEESSIILECFQCGRPDWLEQMLFSENFTRTVQILNIDYLTAEEYADDFHLLKSGTRRINIKKRFFMPGFTKNTGGLIITEQEQQDFAKKNMEGGSLPLRPSTSLRPTPSAGAKTSSRPATPDIAKRQFNILFFSYERDFKPVVNAIAAFQDRMRAANPDFSVCVHAAAGRSFAPFIECVRAAHSPFEIRALPFLRQEEWDRLLYGMDFLCIRGEESLSRAALSGIPYLWHAYIQDDDYQLVKVNALLERMKPYFEESTFQEISALWNEYNKKETAETSGETAGRISSLLEDVLLKTCDEPEQLEKGFRGFAKSLHDNGNLAEHLLAYINEL